MLLSSIEVFSVITFKILELLLIIFPSTFSNLIISIYFKLDGFFVGGILFILFSREVGYNPLKLNRPNLKKHILTFIISYLTIIFIL